MVRPERFELPTFWFVAVRVVRQPTDLESLSSLTSPSVARKNGSCTKGRMTKLIPLRHDRSGPRVNPCNVCGACYHAPLLQDDSKFRKQVFSELSRSHTISPIE